MMLPYSLIAAFILSQCDGRILRTADQSFGQFTLVDSDQRIKANCIRNITKATKLQECCNACLTEKKCQSFNRHREKGFCELLAISKFNETGLLQKDENWVHYETDDDERNIGPVCNHLSPCQPYEICEDTLKNDPAYQCRCRNGFEGTKCQNYKGPGTEKSNPAASCELLLLKFKSVPDGDYWFKEEDEIQQCERKVDGGLSPWSMFGPCDFTDGNCGTQIRERSCINPIPKGGGRACDNLGPQEESRPCTNCTQKCTYDFFTDTLFDLKERKLLGRFSKILYDFTVKLDVKISISELKNATWNNIFRCSKKEWKQAWGKGYPALWIYWQYGKTPNMTIITKTNKNLRFNFPRSKTYFDKKWITIEISQRKMSNGKYVFKIVFNGNRMKPVVNQDTVEYSNMNFFMNANKGSLKGGHVRNLHLEGFCDLQTPKI